MELTSIEQKYYFILYIFEHIGSVSMVSVDMEMENHRAYYAS